MSLANPENCDPKDPDPNGRNSEYAGTEKEHDDGHEDDIVNGEDRGTLDQNPVDGLEDVDMSKQIAAVPLADGVLRFINASNQHASEDKQDDHHQQQPKDELDRS